MFNTQAAELTWDWLEITMGHINCSNWWFKSRVICVCNREKLIWTLIQSVQEQCMMPPQPSEKGSGCKLYYSRAVSQETAIPHEIEACCSSVYHIKI